MKKLNSLLWLYLAGKGEDDNGDENGTDGSHFLKEFSGFQLLYGLKCQTLVDRTNHRNFDS